MDLPLEQEELLRLYLLGATSPEEDEQIEAALQDADLKGELLLVEEDLIDDYALGLMSIGDRELFETNFLTTTERRQKLSIAQASVRYAAGQNAVMEAAAVKPIKEAVRPESVGKPQPDPQSSIVNIVSQSRSWWQALFYPAWKIPIYAVMVIGVGVAAWQSLQNRSDIPIALAALNQAYSQQRPLEVRITNFKHAPYPRLRGGDKDRTDTIALERAERILLDEIAQHPTAAAQHALGQLYLTQQKLDEAQDLFNKALQAEPRNAQIYSDLGTALFVKWNSQRSIVPLATSEEIKRQSLEQLSRALTLDDRLLEARFNRALLYQSAGQIQLARDEWQRYLSLDPGSPWADEARIYIKNLP
jgi:tetratricopeptide (TPR) repeat protein